MKILNSLLSVILAISLFFAIMTFAISIPIFFRPFYYWQIQPLDIPNETGYTADQIVEAYNQLMDFLVWGKPFGTGVFPYSQAGKAHFVDCQTLFLLNNIVLIVSVIVSITLIVLDKLGILHLQSEHNRKPWYYVGWLGIVVFVIVIALSIADFGIMFTLFHMLFFPNKTNWVFDPMTDPIVDALPKQFFVNCAVLISVVALLCFVACIVTDEVRYRRQKRTAKHPICPQHCKK